MKQLLPITKPGKKLAVQASQGNEFTVTGYFLLPTSTENFLNNNANRKKNVIAEFFNKKGSSLNQSP